VVIRRDIIKSFPVQHIIMKSCEIVAVMQRYLSGKGLDMTPDVGVDFIKENFNMSMDSGRKKLDESFKSAEKTYKVMFLPFYTEDGKALMYKSDHWNRCNPYGKWTLETAVSRNPSSSPLEEMNILDSIGCIAVKA
jgi:hypothetical protein